MLDFLSVPSRGDRVLPSFTELDSAILAPSPGWSLSIGHQLLAQLPLNDITEPDEGELARNCVNSASVDDDGHLG